MSALTKEQILHIANLARIHVSDEEVEKFSSELGSILAFVDQIAKVNIGGSAGKLSDHRNRSRDDAVAPLESVYDLVEAAPAHQDHFVKVPKVIGE